MLDTCGLENDPTSGNLTLSIIDKDRAATLDTFLHDQLVQKKEEFVNFGLAYNCPKLDSSDAKDLNQSDQANEGIKQKNLSDLKSAFNQAHSNVRVSRTKIEFGADGCSAPLISIDGQPLVNPSNVTCLEVS